MNLSALGNALIYSVLGILIFVVAFVFIDKVTPFHLWKEIVRGQERRARRIARRDVDRHVHHNRCRGALGVGRTIPLCFPDCRLRADL